MGKGEIIHDEQVLLFPHCFLKTCSTDTLEPGLVWERVNDLRKQPFEKVVGKGENAGNQHLLLFPQCFLPFLEQISIFQSHVFCCLQMFSIWTSQKFCHFVKGSNFITIS